MKGAVATNMTISRIRCVVKLCAWPLRAVALSGLLALLTGSAAGQQSPVPGPEKKPGEAAAKPPISPLPDSGRLTLRDAITLALKNNLGVRVAGTQVDEAAGTRERRQAALLPHVTSQSYANLQTINLKAMGFSLPGFPIPSTVGPFSNFNFRLYADQMLFDRQTYHTLQSSKKDQESTKLTYQDTRDLVIRQAAGYYLDAQAAAAEVEAADARVTTSQALEKLARDQHTTGLATGVDVLRAQVQLQRDQQGLLVARDSYQTALLVLQRFLGVRPGAPLELAERLEFHGIPTPEIEQALRTGLEARSDYRALRAQREALVEQQRASRARYLPTFSVSGNYGAFGRSFGALPGIGLIQGTLSITLFDRDRNGEQKELESRLQRVDAQMADLERGIEQDVRKAILDLESTEQQVNVTQAGVELAGSELKLAEDRFRQGVTDNIEVITAQSSLESAQDDHITALARHADARVAMARALGATEEIYEHYLGPK